MRIFIAAIFVVQMILIVSNSAQANDKERLKTFATLWSNISFEEKRSFLLGYHLAIKETCTFTAGEKSKKQQKMVKMI